MLILKIILGLLALLYYFILVSDRKKYQKENTIHNTLKAIDCSIWALICMLVIIAL